MVFAINKIDKPGANPDKIREDLANMNLLVEEWGGKYQCQEISAKKGIGVDELMDKVLLEADLLELKANPNRKATGTVIESSLDKGRGFVSTVLVSNGTLKTGDIVIAGTSWGKVKALFNERNQRIEKAGPADPCIVLGLNGAPTAGDTFHVLETEQEAREIANKREQLQREQGLRTQKRLTLGDISHRIARGEFHELNIIVKGDTNGSVEALADSFLKLSTEKVQVNVISKAVGQISENDVMLASASDAVIVGFQVRPVCRRARKLADREGVEINTYSIIYDALDDIKSAMVGMLDKVKRKVVTGQVDVRQVFKISKVGTVAWWSRHRRQGAQQGQGTRHPRRYRHPHRRHQRAQALQGRRQGGGNGSGVWYLARQLQRHRGGRHPGDLHRDRGGAEALSRLRGLNGRGYCLRPAPRQPPAPYLIKIWPQRQPTAKDGAPLAACFSKSRTIQTMEEIKEEKNALVREIADKKYEYGFTTDVETDIIPVGLNEDIVRLISQKEARARVDAGVSPARLPPLADAQAAHMGTCAHPAHRLPGHLLLRRPAGEEAAEQGDRPRTGEDFRQARHSLEERLALSGTAVDAIMDSVSVKTTFKEKLREKGVIFCSIGEAIQTHPDLVRQYLGTVVPYGDNFFAALNSAVFSDGSFVYIPQGCTLSDGAEQLLPHQRAQHGTV